MGRIAYLDESQRAGGFALAALAVEHASVEAVRRQLRGVAPRGGVHRRHFTRETDRDRKMLLDVYRELPGSAVSVYVVEGRGRPVDQRAEALELLVGHLVEGGLSRLVLDHVEEHQQKRDRRVLASALRGHDVSYCHETPHSRETMLWVPDAAAWCVGRRPWRSHLDGWVTVLRA